MIGWRKLGVISVASWHEDRKLTRAVPAQPGFGGGGEQSTLSQRSMELQAAACRVGDGEGQEAFTRCFSCTPRRSVPSSILSSVHGLKWVFRLRSYKRGSRRRTGIQGLTNPTVDNIGGRGVGEDTMETQRGRRNEKWRSCISHYSVLDKARTGIGSIPIISMPFQTTAIQIICPR